MLSSFAKNSLELGDVFGEVVYHEFGVLHDDVSDEPVVRRLYLQLLLRLSPPNNTLDQIARCTVSR